MLLREKRRAIAVLKDSLEVARLTRPFALQNVGQIKSNGERDSVEVRTTDGDILSNADGPEVIRLKRTFVLQVVG